MQSTGHTSTQAVSLVPMHGSAITYAIERSPCKKGCMQACSANLSYCAEAILYTPKYARHGRSGGRAKYRGACPFCCRYRRRTDRMIPGRSGVEVRMRLSLSAVAFVALLCLNGTSVSQAQ